ncbi:thiamine/thiamine pyrophosphate ABC transporter permease [Marinobacter salinisoli]|uniref:Thiamine transport system permease protein ThiP n=1 Tax=Marinobacter salinisoli TaxID=2769486 RepID=A0ABX7MP25_9GAMM|nr:thiamine/thiamine pyrophosphate ABC transporter permease [Marinobacter salinisoli]QSP93984.1 thiamine/thiamine pyrophosphate ABC transporter permease [Marinobacter salinisoli]
MERPVHPPLSNPRWLRWPGIVLAAGILCVASVGVGALLWQSADLPFRDLWTSPYLRNVVSFSIWQATLSTLFSILLAIPLARALDRHRAFPGRSLLLRLMELSLVIPTIVAVSGLVGIYGRQGWLTGWLFPVHGQQIWNLYGLNGIVLAHVFFNAPLAARIFLVALESVPEPQRRIASQLGLGNIWLWRSLEWPAVKAILPGLATLVFTLCFTSFAIVMTLGGGPGSTTLEVAIYQALRFEFDFSRAAMLAIVQMLICGSLWYLAVRRGMDSALVPARHLAMAPRRKDSVGPGRFGDYLLIAGFTLFLLLPLIFVTLKGVPGVAGALSPLQDSVLLKATLRSLLIALPAGLISVIAALLILGAYRVSVSPVLARLPATLAHLPLFVPPLVLGTGLFLALRPKLGMSTEGLALVALINALMALPFVLQLIRGPLNAIDPMTLRQADQLNIRGWYRWQQLYWPRLRRPLALSLAYGVGLSLGDFGVIALFGASNQPTIPVLLYQQLGSYQMQAAATTGLWLLILLLGLFAVAATFSRTPARSSPKDTKGVHQCLM